MYDTQLLQLIEADLLPAQQLLELLQAESLALHGRDMQSLENILAHKQSLIVLLDQNGRRRSELLASLNLSPDRDGLEALARQSHLGAQLRTQIELLGRTLGECQAVNEGNGRSITLQQMTTANQLRILMGGEAPSLYDNRGSTSLLAKPRALSQA